MKYIPYNVALQTLKLFVSKDAEPLGCDDHVIFYTLVGDEEHYKKFIIPDWMYKYL